MRHDHNTLRLHAAIGYITPTTTSTKAAALGSAPPAAQGYDVRAPSASPTIDNKPKPTARAHLPMRADPPPDPWL